MRYKLLGNSGLRVAELCLGTMTFGTPGWGTDPGEAARIYARYRELGGNFVDTANELYGGGRSEDVLGGLLAGHREDMVVATKYSLALPGSANPNLGGNHRKSLRRSLEASLQRLGCDYVDLLWVHAWDWFTPLEEMMRALDDLVRAGKVLYLGISNAPAWVVARCNSLAQHNGWTPFVALQLEYNLLERAIEQELLPMAGHFGLGVAAWSPLASGILSGKYGSDGQEARRLDQAQLKTVDERGLAVAAAVGQVARELGRTPAQVALNWLRARPGVIPLLGVRTFAQLEDNLGCLDFRLDDDTVARLSALTAPAAQYPHDYLEKYRDIINGGFYQRLDPD